MPFTIAFDLDGVIIDHTNNKIKRAKELGHIIRPEDISSEILKKVLPQDDYWAVKKFIYNQGTPTAELMKGVVGAIEVLKSRDYHLVIISRRAKESREIALDWLRKHELFKYIKKKDVYFVDTDSDKSIIAGRLGVNAFIDDKLTVLELLEDVPIKILFDPFDCIQLKTQSIKKIKNWQSFSASNIESILAINS